MANGRLLHQLCDGKCRKDLRGLIGFLGRVLGCGHSGDPPFDVSNPDAVEHAACPEAKCGWTLHNETLFYSRQRPSDGIDIDSFIRRKGDISMKAVNNVDTIAAGEDPLVIVAPAAYTTGASMPL